MAEAREVVVTGLGLVSCAGEGVEAHLAALTAGGPPRADEGSFPPYLVHPVAPLNYDLQIPKKSDQRQMEPWQKLGVYAAGLALDSAGAKADADLKHAMHLIVAAGGGERDYAVDGQILTGLKAAKDKSAAERGAYLNERLMGDLRPTLFLAQLSNLLAGNIAIVHGVTGASRTFMGEESAGVDALRVARERIAAGQIDICLVGGSYNAERPDVLLIYEMGGYLWRQPFAPVRERAGEGGFILGSGAAFLVLESVEHAERRGAAPVARLDAVASDRSRRQPGAVKSSLAKLGASIATGGESLVLSGATGVASLTAEEIEAVEALVPDAKVLTSGDLVGHTMEPQALFGAALAAALIQAGEARDALVTSVGHRRGEGLIRLSAAG
ncbi:MAG TPA: beta-ketoacyl-ACP synthase [Beijerinckiaceae bacterium]|jgi:3-oxoacyl-[acyl-carrier-protein] synthase II